MRIIDTHAHLFDEVFAEDLEEVVSRALQNDVEKVFLPVSYTHLFAYTRARGV